MSPELITVDGEVVAVRLGGAEFPYEPETGESTILKKVLHGFRLSDIPRELVIKPVESIADGYIEIENNIGLSSFSGGSALAFVEIMFRRKYWDDEVGLSPYVEAYRLAIREHGNAEETDFQDDGDYIFLYYEITISEDSAIGEAIKSVEGIISAIEERAEQLVRRRQDPLLGICDRGSFDADLGFALRNATTSIGLLLADIDRFKMVNDEYGHQTGDMVLRAVAQVLSAQCGQIGATAYRYGGEELSAILPGANDQSIIDLAEVVRQEVEKLSFAKVLQLRVTISLGTALAPRDGDNAEKLLKEVDAALYAAKKDGRNRVGRSI
jgi:diguanylate cyclase (GGDEF)-like protein